LPDPQGPNVRNIEHDAGEFKSKDQQRPYQHADLDRSQGSQIRLLRLLPGNYSDDIHCQLFQADLETDPEYEAVSYTWADDTGDASLSQKIWISGNSLMVTANCERALRRLRNQYASRTLWVDSVCINQTNLQERYHQVGQMKEVYQQAAQVLIYAGEATDSSDSLLNVLSDVRQGIRTVSEHQWRIRFWKHYQDFFSRSWFQRVWVLQEVLLARRASITAGAKSVNWRTFLLPLQGDRFIPAICQWSEFPGIDMELLPALQGGRNCFAADPRDKVYALLGLLNHDARAHISPNYAWSTKEVFVHIAVQGILCQGTLEVLSYVGRPDGRISDSLPSWVPDWSSTSRKLILPSQPHRKKRAGLFFLVARANPQLQSLDERVELSKSAMLKKEEKRQVSVNDASIGANPPAYDFRALIIHATHLADITYTLDSCDGVLPTPDENPHDPSYNSKDCREKIQFFERLVERMPWTPKNIPIPQDFLGSSLCTCAVCARPFFEQYAIMEGEEESCSWTEKGHRFYSVPNTNDSDLGYMYTRHTYCYNRDRFRDFLRDTREYRAERTIFTTDQTLGLGPDFCRAGDRVFYPDCARVPVVLRSMGSHYIVIGECYLYGAEGLVDGRALEEIMVR
jgi:hypothetical protein